MRPTKEDLRKMEENNKGLPLDYWCNTCGSKTDYLGMALEEINALTKELEEYKLGASVEARMGDEARAEIESLRKELESLKAPMKHYSGKVYDLTQANFNRVLAELGAVKAEYFEFQKAALSKDGARITEINHWRLRHQRLKEALCEIRGEYNSKFYPPFETLERTMDCATDALTADSLHDKAGEGEKT